MKLRRSSLSLVLVALVCGAASHRPALAQQQGRGQTGAYQNPREVSLDRIVRRAFAGYFRRGQYEQMAAASFYPIGWSRDGKFAYYVEPVDEACGCYFAELHIIDLRTDKVLWKFDYEGESTEDAKKQRKPYSLATLWRDKRAEFSARLREHGIIAQGRFAFQTFPLVYQGDRLTTDISIKENKDEETRPYGIISEATLRLNSRKSGRKTLFQESYGEVRPLDLEVLGYLKSPYEERIAVVLMEVYRGWEGPPHTGHFKISGATLASGFK